MRSKALLILIVLTVAIALAAVMTRNEKSDAAGAGEPLFADFLNNINEITTVVGVGRGETFTLVREGNRWLVVEKNGYPADQNNARQLVLGTARLKRIEAKTSNPDLYAKIGLDDINDENGNAVQYSFKNAAGNTLVELLVGNSRLGRSDPQLNEYFVREPAMAQTWLVEGKLPDAIGALEWLDSNVLTVHRERVREVTIRHPDGAVVAISKQRPSQRTFDVQGVPEGVEAESQFMVSDLGRALATLDMEDVIPASEASVPDDGLRVEMTTFDGLRVILNSVEDGERTLARVQASFDESLIAPEFFPGGAQAEGESANLLSAQAVRDDVSRFNDNWQGWTYVLPDYRAKYMSVKNEDFLKSSKEKEKKAGGG